MCLHVGFGALNLVLTLCVGAPAVSGQMDRLRTDGCMDGEMDKLKPIYPLFKFTEQGYNEILKKFFHIPIYFLILKTNCYSGDPL